MEVMKLAFKLFLIGGAVFMLGGSSTYAGTCPVNPDNPNNFNPVVKINVIVYNINLGGQPQTVPTVGSTVVLDATPVDSSNKGTNSQNDPVWTCTGPYELNRSTCFQPRGKITATGSVSCSISLDGITSSITFGAGVAPSTGPTSSRPPGDPAEKDTLCAYREGTNQICVPETYGLLAAQCASVPTCVQKGGCTVINRDQCSSQPVVMISRRITIPPADNLGKLIENVFNFSLMIVGIAVFIMAVYGGFLMVLAGGFPEMNSRGRGIITQAFMGAILLLAAYVILNTINPDFVEQRSALPALPTQQPSR